jgi:hypothetical protein
MSPVRPTVELVGTRLDPDAHRVRPTAKPTRTSNGARRDPDPGVPLDQTRLEFRGPAVRDRIDPRELARLLVVGSRGFRARSFPRLPFVPASSLDGKEEVRFVCRRDTSKPIAFSDANRRGLVPARRSCVASCVLAHPLAHRAENPCN